MTFSKKNLLITAAVLLAVLYVGGLVSAVLSTSGYRSSEYPDAPFEPMSPSEPRLLAVQERPMADDSESQKEYEQQATVLATYLYYQGALTRATPEEQEAIREVASDKFVHGREIAEGILKRNPDSVP